MEKEALKKILDNHLVYLGTHEEKFRANLHGANLSDANLSGANLYDANLSGANLTKAITNSRYISISCIGSRKGMTTYDFDNDIIWCGCFKGSLAEFEAQVEKNHPADSTFYQEYMAFIQFIYQLKK
jgi:hypothetical protein